MPGKRDHQYSCPGFLCPIINAQNRSEARIPVFTRQGRPTEIVSLYVPFGSSIPKIEHSGLQ